MLLQDGSETGQINPIWPLIQTERRPDFLVVSDNSGTELSSGWCEEILCPSLYGVAHFRTG